MQRIHSLSSQYKKTLNTINKSLEIVWGSNRLDLIDKLSQLKENTYHQYIRSIGFSRKNGFPASGLFAALEQVLFSTFGSMDTLQYDIETLQDEDPSLEGLTKLSIWYLKDYWELGLLPSVKNKEELELDPSLHSEKERLKHRQILFSEVQANLDKLGIGQVKDLKKAQIFSKKMLQEHIEANKHLLRHKKG